MPSHSNVNPYLRTSRRSKAPAFLALLFVGVLVAGAVGFAFAVGLIGNKAQEVEEEPVVEEEPQEEPEEVEPKTVILAGSIGAGATSSIAAGWDGTIESVSVTAGQVVSQGDEMVAISVQTGNSRTDDASDELQALDDAKGRLATAQEEYEKALAARDSAWEAYEKESKAAANDEAHKQWEADVAAYEEAHAQWEADLEAYEAAVKAAEEEVDRIFEETGEVQAVEIGVEYPGDEPVKPEEPAVATVEKPSDTLDLDVQLAESQVAIYQGEVEQAQAAYDVALEKSQTPIYETRRIKAPTSGTVIELNAQQGAFVSKDDTRPLVVIADTAQLKVQVKRSAIADADFALIKKGQQAKVTFVGVEGTEFDAAVSQASEADGVELRLAKADERLKVGMGATAVITVEDEAQSSQAASS